MASTVAKLCAKCRAKKDTCIKCGKRVVAGRGKPAIICQSCGLGNKKDACVSCGGRVSFSGETAVLCSLCSIGSKANACVVCGKRA